MSCRAGAGVGVDDDPVGVPLLCPFGEGVGHGVGVGLVVVQVGMPRNERGLFEAAQRTGRGGAGVQGVQEPSAVVLRPVSPLGGHSPAVVLEVDQDCVEQICQLVGQK